MVKKILYKNSLGKTIEALNEAFFYNRRIPPARARQTAAWIAGRRGKPGSYAGMFAPTPYDFKRGVRLFTGEMVHSRAAIAHVLGEESCRALLLLKDRNMLVRKALHRASKGILSRLKGSNPFMERGFYCCGTCSVSLWRHMHAGGLKTGKSKLKIGLRTLRLLRDGKGQWHRFPFFYTLLALHETNDPASRAELKYTRPLLNKYLARSGRKSQYARRRHDLARRVIKTG
jgi:hypothetical protein